MNTSDTTPAGEQLVKELTVQNKLGIHARPAAMIVRITNKFKSEVFVEKDEEQVNGKSIMGLMMLAAGKGSKVKFLVTGEDAQQMLNELEQLFARRSRRRGRELVEAHPEQLRRAFRGVAEVGRLVGLAPVGHRREIRRVGL